MKFPFQLIFITFLFPLHINAQKKNALSAINLNESKMQSSSGSELPNQNLFRPDVPPSPQAVAFNRLGEYKVNNNYGAPDINIPLFDIDFHGFKIPLTLHYEASPLKPGYNYDVTGLGWTLSGNSCVSRTIKDRADEEGLFGNPFELDPMERKSGGLFLYKDYKDWVVRFNYQYDSYNIVLPSGRTIPFFMYKENGVMKYDLMSSDRNVKITCSYTSSSIDAFMVKDEYGVTYHFTVADRAGNIYQNDNNAYKNVTWLLTSIDIPSKGTITYEYTPLYTINTSTVDEPIVKVSYLMTLVPNDIAGDASERGCYVTCNFQSQCPVYSMRFLRRISYGPTTVDFNYTPDERNYYHMDKITVSDCGEAVKKYALDVHNSSLMSLAISGQKDKDKLVYNFTYTYNNPGNNTDFWGNRCHSNAKCDIGNFNFFITRNGIDVDSYRRQISSCRCAQLIKNEPDDLDSYFKIKLQSTQFGDTRQPSSPEHNNVLKSITYPNGGQTFFTFENHSFPTATANNGDIEFDRRRQRIIDGGGFRIESIVNYTADGKVASEDYYRYGFTYDEILKNHFPLPLRGYNHVNAHIGCGEAVVDPNLLTFMSFSFSKYKFQSDDFWRMAVGQHSYLERVRIEKGEPWWWDAYFSANTFRSLLNGRRPVVYPEITVYHGNPSDLDKCKSKTVYRYDIYNYNLDRNSYYMSYFTQKDQPDTAYFEAPYINSGYSGLSSIYAERPTQRHLLQSMADYSFNKDKGTWDIVSEEKYTYTGDDISKYGRKFDSDISRGHCGKHTVSMGLGRDDLEIFLHEFYIPTVQRFGRSVVNEKTIKNYRLLPAQNIYWMENTQKESYNYLYPDVLKSKDYYDVFAKKDEYSYIGEAKNEDNDSVIAAMKSRNMLASSVSAETFGYFLNQDTLSGSKMKYGFYGNEILPCKLYERNGKKYEESIQIISYDTYGNPTEIEDLKTGMHTAFLWDKFGRYMTAMIKNATLSQVQAVCTQSDGMPSQSRYAMLKDGLPNAQIQTWNYQPLIGVTSFTDVSGQTIIYEYDDLGRLKSEKRLVKGLKEPEILHEYEYNYINK